MVAFRTQLRLGERRNRCAGRRGRFTVSLEGGLAGQWLTGTATYSAGNTSEFSKAIEVRSSKK